MPEKWQLLSQKTYFHNTNDTAGSEFLIFHICSLLYLLWKRKIRLIDLCTYIHKHLKKCLYTYIYIHMYTYDLRSDVCI